MARYGTLGDYRFADRAEAALDIRGAKVYGPKDQNLGEIDDVIFDEATGAIVFVIVDTGGWLSNNKFIVPPGEIRRSLQHEDDFLVDLTKEQIENFPPYDGTMLTSEEKWVDYERRYRSKRVEKPVMHREAADRNITLTSRQQVGADSGAISEADADTAELEVTSIRTEGMMEITPSGPSLRWSAFEESLRQRREEVLQSSIENVKRASGESNFSEYERMERRKAS